MTESALTPADAAARAEHAALPGGVGDRFAGYGVMGLPFASGHVLAMRRFAASSIGPGYTSVWHRDPAGTWTFWQDQADDQACSRYFSAGVGETVRTPVEVAWPNATTLRVAVPAVGLEWSSTLRTTAATRVLNGMGRLMPERAWRSTTVLAAMAPVAGRALRAGRVGMVGTSPNGHAFVANPRQLWVIDDATARLGNDDLGAPGPLAQQAALGDFWIPQRGVFAIGQAFFADPTDPG